MGAPSRIRPHLTLAALRAGMQACRDAATARRWQVVLLRAMGETAARTATVTGLGPRSVERITARYNARGPDGLVDERSRDGRGRAPLLTPAQRAALRTALAGPAPGGGLWTAPKVARWIAQQTGRDFVWAQRGWDYLDALGFTLQRPRRTHAGADAAAQAAFKKSARRSSPPSASSTPLQR
jgi:transposase